MTWNWDAFAALCTVSVAIGGMIMVWHKFSRENAVIRKQVEEHDKQIAIIMVDKASCQTVLKLANAIENLEKVMMAHHLDATIHRNKDFEVRMDQLAVNLDKFANENREDHLEIKRKIGIA